MPTYASKTEVSSDKSRAEIERTLARYGASSFMYGWDQLRALIAFEMHGRRLKFILPMPNRDDFKRTPTKRQLRSATAAEAAYEQAVRQRWRALALVIKAKLEAVEAGIAEFEEEFLAHIVLPDGRTVGDFMVPQIAAVYESGRMPPLLLVGSVEE
jgi:hypothetical protein